MPSPPRIIADRYRIVEEAGRGGMGSVWRCVDERLGREVAVKQVGRMPGESVTDQARALREARSLAALNHPHVVSVYDAVAEDDHIWLVMEYVPGRTLSQILREDGPLPPARVAWIGAQVADGLTAAHARGTVHRDVKPGNVLVGEDDRAKISDFGIARTAGEENLTQSGILSGTPAYFAPEVARGGEPRPASDVWALGATLFAAVEGRAPYDHDPNPLAVLATIAAEEPPSPERAGPLTEPIRRMLDRDPETRWSMVDVAQALHRLNEQGATAPDTREETRAFAAPVPVDQAEPASPPAAVTDTGPSPRRRRGPLLVGGLVALLVAAIAVLVLRDVVGDAPTAEEPSGSAASEGSSPDAPESSATDEPEATQSTDTTESTQSPAASGGSRTAFVEDYYAALPGDTEAGYARLAPAYQDETSYESYEGFWSTVEDVTVEEVAPVGADAVDVTLVYNGEEQEVRRIYLVRDGDGWLIADDELDP